MPSNPERTAAAIVVVPAPPEAVWELVSDPGRFAEWAQLTEEVIRADRPLRLGSTYEERNVVLGRADLVDLGIRQIRCWVTKQRTR